MTEIWSLDALCRCCHADGDFKDLRAIYVVDNVAENYLGMLLETLGVTIKPPPVNASYTICDACIEQLRSATNFKKMVLECETKFDEYCKNELSQNYDIKTEPEYLDDPDDNDYAEDIVDASNNKEFNFKKPVKNIKKEAESIEISIDVKPKIEGKSAKKKNKSSVKAHTTFHIFYEEKSHCCPEMREEKYDFDPSLEGNYDSFLNSSGFPENTVTEWSFPAETALKFTALSRCFVKNNLGKSKSKPKEEESLVVTVKTETGELYSCKNCGVSYDTLDELNQHINEEHFTGLKCLYCPEQFKTESAYKVHNRLQHNDTKPFPCEHCGKKLGARLTLVEHVNSVHTKEIYYQCDICLKKFHNKQVLRIHIRKHDGTFRKLICEQCGVGCNDRTNLRYHVMTVHDKIKLFTCNECGKKFSAAKHLKIHIRSHTGERPYECDICNEAFASNETLTVHKKRHTNSGYKCKTCDKSFPTRGTYASHYRKHVGSKPYKCHLCDKEFAGKYSLNRHLFEHTGARPFNCQLCGKDFKQKIQLIRHNRRFHDPNKPAVVKQKCDLCKRTVPNIEKHMQAHSNKPFSCHLCDKRYPERNALNRHLQRHAGIKPHRCELCDKGYIQLKSLRGHIMKVHKLPLKTEQEDHYDSVVTTYTIENLKRK